MRTEHAVDALRSDGTTTDTTTRTVERAESGHEVVVLESIRSMPADRWNAVVEHSRCGGVFHRYEWLEAIETGLSSAPRHVVVTKDGNPIALMPNVLVDVPMTPCTRLTSVYPGFGGPIATTDQEECLPLLCEAAAERCRGRTVVHEIRAGDVESLRYHDLFRSHGYRPAKLGGRFVLDLEAGYDEVVAGMSSSRRKGIERGREHDFEIVEEPITIETLERFYGAYREHMDAVGGDPYPFDFFEALEPMADRLLLLTIRIEGEYAGGFLELLDEERSAVHGFFAAVPQRYYEYHASELLYDYVIRWAIEEGYETYDFGGSDADFRDGVFRFKESFGADLVPNVYWERATSVAWKALEAGRSLYWRRRGRGE